MDGWMDGWTAKCTWWGQRGAVRMMLQCHTKSLKLWSGHTASEPQFKRALMLLPCKVAAAADDAANPCRRGSGRDSAAAAAVAADAAVSAGPLLVCRRHHRRHVAHTGRPSLPAPYSTDAAAASCLPASPRHRRCRRPSRLLTAAAFLSTATNLTTLAPILAPNQSQDPKRLSHQLKARTQSDSGTDSKPSHKDQSSGCCPWWRCRRCSVRFCRCCRCRCRCRCRRRCRCCC
eukprot:191614-Chlamydomonas_euryale.AAC.11